MFEPFTGQARKVMVLAQEEARRLDQGYIGTEHLLLGLLRYDESLADRTLNFLGVTLNEAREQVESMVGRGKGRDVGKASFTPRSKNVLELALREALRLGHNYVDTDHILLGLTNDPNGVAVRALSRLGVDPDEIYREVAGKIGDQETTEQPAISPEDSRYMRASLVRARVEELLVHARCGVTDEERALPQTPRGI